jgi:membrane protein
VTIRSKAVGIQAGAKRYAERAEASRGNHGSVDATYMMLDRDAEVGGAIMAGSLAYRLFIWLLPLALVAIGGIGVGAAAASDSASSAARSLGLRGVVSHSVAQAAQGSSRWYAILIGIPILVWATRNLLRAVVVVHRLVWGDERNVGQKATLAATLRFLVLFLGYFLVRELAVHVGTWTGSYALRTVVGLAGIFAWWLLVSLRLPHHSARWYALIPGALLMAVGLEIVSDLGSYLIASRVNSGESAYGALGIAAGLLFGLYLVSRLVVASALLNATIWERRTARMQA